MFRSSLLMRIEIALYLVFPYKAFMMLCIDILTTPLVRFFGSSMSFELLCLALARVYIVLVCLSRWRLLYWCLLLCSLLYLGAHCRLLVYDLHDLRIWCRLFNLWAFLRRR